MRLLITGGCGFIGSSVIPYLLATRPGWSIINLDLLAYCGSEQNVAGIAEQYGSRYRFVHGDVCDPPLVTELLAACDACIHLAAESHVDRSIADGRPFVQTNIIGTWTLLEAIRSHQRGPGSPSKRLVHVSTDEVYGSLSLDAATDRFTENSPLRPSSPYSASKASADLLVLAAVQTYGIDVVITRCGNNMGPRQYPEKLIPVIIRRLLAGEQLPLYGDGQHVRDWIDVDDHAAALLLVLERGRQGNIYNIGAGVERSNMTVAHEVMRSLGIDERTFSKRIAHVEDRLGHDRRYALNCDKLVSELGWQPVRSQWPEMLRRTVAWYLANPQWLAARSQG